MLRSSYQNSIWRGLSSCLDKLHNIKSDKNVVCFPGWALLNLKPGMESLEKLMI